MWLVWLCARAQVALKTHHSTTPEWTFPDKFTAPLYFCTGSEVQLDVRLIAHHTGLKLQQGSRSAAVAVAEPQPHANNTYACTHSSSWIHEVN